ncbi:MAG: UDP-N-acetylglucosamine 2-epimerase (non-hydrolyzing) [Chitinophagales bacterium]|nr:UDP-N-acetylglucosamine 2-epimerase (non-hydrolyzing) [Chitinophagales bacterium]
MKIVTVLGARPQFIKAAVVSRTFKNYNNIEEIIVHTGQHYDSNMSDSFFNDLDIPTPNYMLKLAGSNHGSMTGGMLKDIEEILLKENPDAVMVYGDTNSTIAGSLAASKLHIPTAHVEAGLRSFNMKMPEEINRILTDRISKWLFCPTEAAVRNLEKEGFKNFNCSIIKNGDVMQDAALFYAKKSSEKSNIINSNNLEIGNFMLCTVHRAENTDSEDRLTSIFQALDEIHKDCQVILPLHPRTKKMLYKYNLSPNITLIDPVGYFDMIEFLKNCKAVITDSGGLQKEAFFFKKPCITLRDETEWVELIENNFNKLAGVDIDKIISIYNKINKFNSNYEMNLYGNGNASNVIATELLNNNNAFKI